MRIQRDEMAPTSCLKQVLFLGFLSTFKERQSGRCQCTGYCVFKFVRLGLYYLCHMIAYNAEMDRFLSYS